MSRVVGVDGVPCAYWSYMAAMMSDRLEGMVAFGKVHDSIPKNVYNDAERFLQSCLRACLNRADLPDIVNRSYALASMREMEFESSDTARIVFLYLTLLSLREGPETLSEDRAKRFAILGEFFARLRNNSHLTPDS